MRTRLSFGVRSGVLGMLTAALALGAGCGDDDGDGTGGTGGTAGSGGQSSKGGSGGKQTTGGTASAGDTGEAGDTGSAGDTSEPTAGTTGEGGAGGAPGTPGEAGAAGDVGEAGAAGGGPMPRTDRDRVIVRLTPDGALDDDFADGGMFVLDVDGLELNDNARNGFVQEDGKIFSAGYTPVDGSNQIVLIRLNDDGTPDTDFSEDGVARVAALAAPGMAEAYGAALQSTGRYVTTGYGRAEAAGAVDLVAFGFTEKGELDTDFGTNGGYLLDVAGDNDRGRNIASLPDDYLLHVGSGTPAAENIDAMILVQAPDGSPANFGQGGFKLYDFGRPDEAFFGVAVSPAGDRAIAVGYTASPAASPAVDDDSVVGIFTVGEDGELTEDFVAVLPLSEDEHDRLWGATIDADGNLYAAGVLDAGGDTRMVLVRIKPDGTLDSTFGEDGLAVVNAVAGGGTETARAVAVQSDGKIVIAGHAEHDPDSDFPDADLVVARFDGDGQLDETFGNDGIAIIDLGPGAGNVSDLLWGMDVDAQDRIVLFASKKAADPTD